MEKQIKRVVIYGLGARFNAFFVKESFVNQTLKKLGYKVVGFLDRDKRKTDTVLVYNEEQFPVTLPEGWTDFSGIQAGTDYIVGVCGGGGHEPSVSHRAIQGRERN